MAKINLFDLEETGMVCSLKGQKIYLYGSNDTGKTFQSMKLPKPLLLMTESGGNGVRGKKQSVTKWAVFKDFVNQLTSEKMVRFDGSTSNDEDDEAENTKSNKCPQYELMQEKFQTIVVDTVENLVDLAEQATCQEFGVRDLSEIQRSRMVMLFYRKDFKTQVNN